MVSRMAETITQTAVPMKAENEKNAVRDTAAKTTVSQPQVCGMGIGFVRRMATAVAR